LFEEVAPVHGVAVRRRKVGIERSSAGGASLPHASQPGRAARANSSIFGNSGYMRSISS
jgi:hypothetical protein